GGQEGDLHPVQLVQDQRQHGEDGRRAEAQSRQSGSRALRTASRVGGRCEIEGRDHSHLLAADLLSRRRQLDTRAHRQVRRPWRGTMSAVARRIARVAWALGVVCLPALLASLLPMFEAAAQGTAAAAAPVTPRTLSRLLLTAAAVAGKRLVAVGEQGYAIYSD